MIWKFNQYYYHAQNICKDYIYVYQSHTQSAVTYNMCIKLLTLETDDHVYVTDIYLFFIPFSPQRERQAGAARARSLRTAERVTGGPSAVPQGSLLLPLSQVPRPSAQQEQAGEAH